MWLVLIGLLLLVLKLAGLGPVAGLSWWWVLAPFAAAVVWWQLADSLGWTMRAAQRREERQVRRRREARLHALGLGPTHNPPTTSFGEEPSKPGRSGDK